MPPFPTHFMQSKLYPNPERKLETDKRDLLTAEGCPRSSSLTVDGNVVFAVCLVTLGGVAPRPQPPALQPVRGPDRIAHAETPCESQTGLRKPEATGLVFQLKELHFGSLKETRARINKGVIRVCGSSATKSYLGI